MDSEFQRNKVLIVCDHYESVKIPENLLKKKHNLALFPVANIPLIEYILESLYQNNLLDVMIVGHENISVVINHIKKTKYARLMKIKFLNYVVASLGDILREIGNCGINFANMLVLFANTFTNLDLNLLIAQQEKYKSKDRSVLATICLFKTKKKKVFPVYGVAENQLVLIDRVSESSKIKMRGIMEKYKQVNIKIGYSSPDYIVLSPEFIDYVIENFDLNTPFEILKTLVHDDIYGHKIMVYFPEEDETIKKANKSVKYKKQEKMPQEAVVCDGNRVIENIEALSLEPDESIYGLYKRSISNLRDYFEINRDIQMRYFFPYTPDVFVAPEE
ncbi:Translation initiation factor eIF-2B subunit epsilon, partial [Dictyocoela roeselum]